VVPRAIDLMRKRILYSVLVIALVLNLGLGAGIYLTYAQTDGKNDVYQNMEMFTRVLEQVRQEYVDGDKLTYQELVYAALRGMLSTLDPHSEFMEADQYDELRKDTEGSFGGVGLMVGVRDDQLTVIAPVEDTPAYKAGILSGDRIVKIDGRSTEKLGLQESVKHLRGAPGTSVLVTILRPSSGETRDYKLTRANVKVDSVRDLNGKREFPLGEHGIGYVRLTQFGEPTDGELESALKKLEKQGMKALILDLRDNPGGLLEQAVKVCELFLPRNQLVVSTEGQRSEDQSRFQTSSRGRYASLPMVVLVNNGSASASEIVAGCLQDTTAAGVTRAIILGEQTFGKGSVQKIFPLRDGAAFRLTTAKYYTPSHKVIHEKGITPDIEVAATERPEETLRDRSQDGADALPAELPGRTSLLRDVQLERAMDVLRGLDLYTKRSGSQTRASAKRTVSDGETH
jgi:carboxyl-terminal processing protease